MDPGASWRAFGPKSWYWAYWVVYQDGNSLFSLSKIGSWAGKYYPPWSWCSSRHGSQAWHSIPYLLLEIMKGSPSPISLQEFCELKMSLLSAIWQQYLMMPCSCHPGPQLNFSLVTHSWQPSLTQISLMTRYPLLPDRTS